MEKGIVITGKNLQLKNHLIEKMCKGYDFSEIAIFDFKENINIGLTFFTPYMCTKKSKIILVLNFSLAESFEEFYKAVSGKVIVNRWYWTPFTIEIDKLIIVCDKKLTKADFPTVESFTRRFEIVEL